MKRPLKSFVTADVPEDRVARLYAGTLGRVAARARRRRAAVVAASAALVVLAIFGLRAWRAQPPVVAVNDRGFVLHDGSRAFFGDRTELKVEEDGPHATRLSLSAGTVRFDVTHDPARSFIVEAGAYTIVDVGTVFEVELDQAGVRVAVERGVVRILDHGEVAAELHGGQSWQSSAKEGGSEPSVPVIAVSDLPPSIPPPSPSVNREALVEFQRVATGDGAARAYEVLGHDRFVLAVATAGPKELFELADGANLSGHPQDAALAYDALRRRYRNDSRAAIAAFQLGRLRQDKLGDPGGAEEALRDVMTLAADPSMREDAESRRVTALETLGDKDGCRKARDEYLRHQPSGVHAKSVAGRCGGN